MRIGIDIDNTIVNTRESVFKYKRKSKFKKYKGYYLDWPKEAQEEFLMTYVEQIHLNATVKEYAKDAIDQLKKMGNEIVLITYRNNNFSNQSEKNTIQYLQQHHIYYDEILFGAFDKGRICQEKKIDLLIDDSLVNIESAVKAGIKVLVYPMFYNKNTSYPRADNWKEVVKYIQNFDQ